MIYFRLFVFFLLTAPTQTLSSYAEESIFERPFITHIKFMPLPVDFYDLKVRLYLPGRNFLECDLEKGPIILKLDHPIDPGQKTINYYARQPYTFLNPEEASVVSKENGLLTGAAHSFHVPNEGGPFEKDAIGRLWPANFPIGKMTSTLELTLFYDAKKTDVYIIKSRFIPAA